MSYSYSDIEALNCRCCGGVLKVKSSLCVCDYCGATNFISDVASKYVNQLNRANKLRQEREFDNAARIYDIILEENGPSSDILWLRTLCEYGIEYVPDPVSDKYIPTLHRINDESILSYHSYIDALSLADKAEKESLQKEAEYINTIQNEYLHIAENEAPYDVFICYKETDEDTGEKTEDVVLAEQLYNDLTGRGFKVFFAKETLKTKLSIDYEPYIFAALKSSKAMVIIGTKSEYFLSVWVKNEWGRFLKLMQNDENKQMFFACDDPDELPRAFATKQAQLLGEDNALKNIADNVERFLKEKKGRSPETTDSELEILYNRALSYVRSRNEFSAGPYIERLIERFPEYAPGYWLRMLNTYKANDQILIRMPLNIYSNPDYQKAVSLAVGDLKQEYIEIAALCKKNLAEQEEFDKILEEKSIEYVTNFRKTKLGQKKKEIMDNISRNATTVDIYNNKIRLTFGIGFPVLIVGVFLFLILWVDPFNSIYYRTDSGLMATLVSLPLLLGGSIVLLSYNKVIDILTAITVLLLLIIPAATDAYPVLLRFLAISTPIVIYLTTSRIDYLNKYKKRRRMASSEIESGLVELKKLTGDVCEEFQVLASKLVKQYKEEKNIISIIEIRDDDFIKAQKNFNNMFETAKNKYMKYVYVSEDLVSDVYKKNESELGISAMVLSVIPLLGLLSFILAVTDIARDKYRESKHILAITAIGIDTLQVIIPLGIFFAVLRG
ncbi:MAG: toll/interleukin-1 receptor domain-containing protein [Lachnospiraceae bacterium]|nr:toll/interleukin-1 receptor domain-containing protein [Lachnospiraceae bacterium]